MYKRGNKFTRFLKRNSFYIVLVVTVIAFIGVGGSLYRVGERLNGTVSVDPNGDDYTAQVSTEEIDLSEVLQTPTLTPAPTPEETLPAESQAPLQKPFSLQKPLDGEVIIAYTADSLIYSETMDDYRSHKGIDIKGQLTAPVMAAEDGVVESITKDGPMGITIVINHQNGFKTVYSNLSTDAMVKVDQKVAKGMVISGVGDTAPTEAALPPHLHFEVIKDGKHVNPLENISY